MILPSAPMGQFYLAGDTGLALKLGQRESYDLDFFSQHEFHTFRSTFGPTISMVDAFAIAAVDYGVQRFDVHARTECYRGRLTEPLLPPESVASIRIDECRKSSANHEHNECCADPPDLEHDSYHEQQ